GGCGRGRLFLCFRRVGQVDGQYPERRCGQRAGIHALDRFSVKERHREHISEEEEMSEAGIDAGLIEKHNESRMEALRRDYEALGEQLDRRGIAIDGVKERVAAFGVAIPSWGVGTGGTRFARFPGPGEPRDIFDKLADCAVIQSLTRATPTVSLHIPWDKADPALLREAAQRLGLGFDAMNSNTFQDHPGDRYSYKFGSLSHTDAATRRQAIEHNIECIEIGKAIGSRALTVWIGDGSNFPGQSNFTKAFERYLDSMR